MMNATSIGENAEAFDPQIHHLLMDAHPALFNESDPVPLKIGIDEDIVLAHPGIDVPALHAFLQAWTSRRAYLESVVARRPRLGLDAAICGEIEPWQVGYAKRMLGIPLRRRTARPAPPHIRIRQIRDNNPVGTDLQGEDLAFVLEVLAYHPEAKEKLADRAGIRIAEYRAGQNCLAVVRGDGTLEPFSVNKCMDNHPAGLPAKWARGKVQQKDPSQAGTSKAGASEAA